MIGQYVSANDSINHYVVENDKNWLEFFQKEQKVSKNTNIVNLELITEPYLDDSEVLMYKDFDSVFSDKVFDLIIIDGPYGGNAKKYSRVDTMKILPGCLGSSFVIIMDDVIIDNC